VDLARQSGQLAMAVTMQIVGSPVHAVPGAKRVVAEHQPDAVLHQLHIGLHARPTGQSSRIRTVVIAGHQMLGAVEPGEQRRHSLWRHAVGEIAEMPYLVVPADGLVPAPNERLVHLGNGAKRPLEASESTAMPEMGVAGEPDGHAMLAAADAA